MSWLAFRLSSIPLTSSLKFAIWRIASAAVALLWCGVALADPPPGTDLNSPRHAWFERQHSVGGAWCCNVADGHVLEDKDWRADGSGYSVRIEGKWEPIPDDAIRDPAGGPNPTGHAIVWYVVNEWGIRVYCFSPGFLY